MGNATHMGSNFSEFVRVRKVTTPVRVRLLFCAVETRIYGVVFLEWHKARRGLTQSLSLNRVLTPSRYCCPSFTRVFGQAVLWVQFAP